KWSKQDFEDKYEAMKKLAERLEEIVTKVKPAKGYVLPAEAGAYTTHFAQAFLGSPGLCWNSAARMADPFGDGFVDSVEKPSATLRVHAAPLLAVRSCAADT